MTGEKGLSVYYPLPFIPLSCPPSLYLALCLVGGACMYVEGAGGVCLEAVGPFPSWLRKPAGYYY